MSYDITFIINTGIKDYPIVDCGNYTYNISPMHKKAMGYRLSELHGKTGKELVPILRKGVREMEDNPDIYKKLNPENGWGNYEGALLYLKTIYEAALQHPKAKLDVH